MRAHLSWWAALGIGLLCQTTLFPLVLPAAWTPDVTRALVLWAAVTGMPRGGPLIAFLSGLALDAASGAPMGFGAGLRLFLYGLARPLRGVFFDDRPVLLLPFAVAGALADGLAAWFLSWIALPSPFPAAAVAAISWRQALADALVVPLVFLALELASGRRPAPRLARELIA